MVRGFVKCPQPCSGEHRAPRSPTRLGAPVGITAQRREGTLLPNSGAEVLETQIHRCLRGVPHSTVRVLEDWGSR